MNMNMQIKTELAELIEECYIKKNRSQNKAHGNFINLFIPLQFQIFFQLTVSSVENPQIRQQNPLSYSIFIQSQIGDDL